jgi:uncharacterized phage protein gp47/JayE
MTTNPYFNANGLRTLTLTEIRENMREATEAHSDLGAVVSTGADSIYGMHLDVAAAAIEDCYRLIDDIWASMDPDQAEGVAQDNLNRLRGAVRNPARYSTVTLTLSGTPATVIAAGKISEIPNGGARWIHDAAATIGGGGTVDVLATAEDSGPVVAAPGAITGIVTAVTGWTGVTNAAAAELGEDDETNADYRLRSEGTALGTTTEEGIYTRISELDDVDAVVVLSNRSNVVDSNGTNPHAMWIVIYPNTADQTAIAEAIWGDAGACAGIEMRGAVTKTVTDINGEVETIAWDWATAADVHCYVGVTKDSDYPTDGDDLIEALVIAYFATLGVGDDVYPAQIAGAVIKGVGDLAGVPGIMTIVVGVKVGSSAGAGDTAPIDLVINQYADLDETDVIVVSA